MKERKVKFGKVPTNSNDFYITNSKSNLIKSSYDVTSKSSV